MLLIFLKEKKLKNFSLRLQSTAATSVLKRLYMHELKYFYFFSGRRFSAATRNMKARKFIVGGHKLLNYITLHVLPAENTVS